MSNVTCPRCNEPFTNEADLELQKEEVSVNDILSCGNCANDFIVNSVIPLELEEYDEDDEEIYDDEE